MSISSSAWPGLTMSSTGRHSTGSALALLSSGRRLRSPRAGSSESHRTGPRSRRPSPRPRRCLFCRGSDRSPTLVFLPDGLELVIGKGRLPAERVVTPRLVTDAHLLALARRHGARLVTLDRGVAAMAGHEASDVVLVPVSGA